MNSSNLNLVFFCIAEKASKPEELCGYIAAGDSVIQLYCVSLQYVFFLLHSSSVVKFFRDLNIIIPVFSKFSLGEFFVTASIT
jgi:hypothetical protein